MQSLLSLWTSLDNRRRIIVLGATVAMFLAVLGVARVAGTPNLALLYSGLDAATAGEVVAVLEQRNVGYEIRGDAIYVDAAQRDSLRMTLASEGLPKTTGTGYELLDSLSGFGTTSQMFDAAYWRAKEGELARTILASPQIRAARVHIAQAPSQPFKLTETPTASVTVTTNSGSLSARQAAAIRHLVAAAVSGLLPENVAVIDSVAGFIPSESDDSAPSLSGDARAGEMRKNIERLLAARVGPGKAVVEVSVDVETAREAVTEHTFDPQSRVAISSETENRSGSATGASGDVTVASNLPQGNATAAGGDKSQTSETKETINYEVSETQRDILRIPGAIRKISVAVLVDDQTVTAADGTISRQPRSDEELATLRELVSSAVGLDTVRGDVLTLKSLAFQTGPAEGVLIEAGMLSAFANFDLMSMIQIGVLATVALILGLFVVRPVLMSPARAVPGLAGPMAQLALPGGSNSFNDIQNALNGEIDDGRDLSSFGGPGGKTPADENLDPVERLRRLITERQAESVEILRGWMEQDEEQV